MTASREFELKLQLRPEDVRRVVRSPLLTGASQARPREHLRSVYFDTKSQALHRAGMTLRVRKIGDTHVQTVKSGENIVDRREWEVQVPGAEPDLSAIAKTPASDVLSAGRAHGKRKPREALRALFAVDVYRSAWTIEKDGAEVELVIDRGAIRGGGGEASVCEAELELKSGPARALFDMAADLAAATGARLSFASKGERGYRLLAGECTAETNFAAWLDPGMRTQDALRRIMHAGLRQLFDHHAVLAERQDPAALHQMRVGLRRIRAAMNLFRPLLGTDPQYEPLRADLRWITAHLGSVRDLDVFRGGEILAQASAAGIPGIHALSALLEERHRRAYEALTEVLASPRTLRIGVELLRLIEDGDWVHSRGREVRQLRRQPIEKFAGKILRRRARRLHRDAKSLAKLSPQARHEVRIAAKKLRYTVEFMAGAAPARKIDRIAGLLKRMQDHLGRLNDAEVARAMMLSLANEASASVGGQGNHLFAAGAVFGVGLPDEAAALAEVCAARKELGELRPFWSRW